jgi:hypothetical protein
MFLKIEDSHLVFFPVSRRKINEKWMKTNWGDFPFPNGADPSNRFYKSEVAKTTKQDQ